MWQMFGHVDSYARLATALERDVFVFGKELVQRLHDVVGLLRQEDPMGVLQRINDTIHLRDSAWGR